MIFSGDPAADTYAFAGIREAEKVQQEAAQKMLDDLAAEFRAQDRAATTYSSVAPTAAELLRYAENVKADLIVVGRFERSRLDRLLLGSISRNIVIGAKTSVLVVKRAAELKHGPIPALFATDHSEYCSKCAERLLELEPHGLGHLTVLSVFPEPELTRIRRTLPNSAPSIEKTILKALEQATQNLAKEMCRLTSLNSAEFVVGQPGNVVDEILTRSKSELLILGARGHNWLERVALGSFSFQQATTSPHSILILRV